MKSMGGLNGVTILVSVVSSALISSIMSYVLITFFIKKLDTTTTGFLNEVKEISIKTLSRQS